MLEIIRQHIHEQGWGITPIVGQAFFVLFDNRHYLNIRFCNGKLKIMDLIWSDKTWHGLKTDSCPYYNIDLEHPLAIDRLDALIKTLQ